jgi:phosphatidylserine/phosphatidylglycerophosphate/cardiolipin synthase-like enzyme
MRSTLAVTLAALALATPLCAQEQPERIREVLAGEDATVIFSPHGGYAPQNYLKRFRNSQGEREWATQGGAVAEMIRRCHPNSRVRLASFRISDRSQIVDALFEVAETKNVEVKLWLKGPPGLTYMLSGHEAIASRANEYLRRRAQQGKQDEWGDVQVMIGTEAQMDAFGKYNDMHEKFGVIDVNPVHQPGYNHAFLGTSNLSSSSDLSHNEHRVLFHSNPKATQALWSEFKRLWDHLGECRTYVDGDPSQSPNATPEEARIELPGGGHADEAADDVLQFRFTYEKRNGSFHRISQDFVDAVRQADRLQPGEVVWVAQFGFQISSITNAIMEAARQNPLVQFRIMVHMKEGEGWSVRRLVESGLDNVQVRVKWDSNKLILREGQAPELPDHDTGPMPALLHHKSMIVGDHVMLTGSFNFFGDADSQGENVVIVRNHLDARYAHLLDDAQAEFQALWDAPVMFDAAKIHGPDGLLKTIGRLSGEDGFLATLRATSSMPRTVAQIHQQVSSQPGLDTLTEGTVGEWLEALERFDFVDQDADGRYRRAGDPDVAAHARKPAVREQAQEGPQPGSISGKLSRSLDGDLLLQAGAQSYAVLGEGELVDTLWELTGREVTLYGTIDSAGAALQPERLDAPLLTWVDGTAAQGAFTAQGGQQALVVLGPAAEVVRRADADVEVKGYVFEDAVYALSVRAYPNRDGSRVSHNWKPVGELSKGQAVEILRHGWGGWTKVRLPDGVEGWVRGSHLDLGKAQAGAIQALPGGGQ